VVPNTERSIKGRLNYPSVQITFHLKDFPLAFGGLALPGRPQTTKNIYILLF
jgi:hypothetical protein